MKTIITTAAFLFASFAINAQVNSIHLLNYANNTISFSMKKEVNTQYFLLYAAKNNNSFEMVQRIAGKGNSMVPQNYSHYINLNDYNQYYITQINMDGTQQTSPIMHITKPKPTQPHQKTTSQPINLIVQQ